MGGREKTEDVRRWLGGVPRAFCLCLGKKAVQITVSWSSDFCFFLPSSPQLIWGRRRGSLDNGRKGCCHRVREFILSVSGPLYYQPLTSLSRGVPSSGDKEPNIPPDRSQFWAKDKLAMVLPSCPSNPLWSHSSRSWTLLSIIILHISDELSNNNNSKHLHVMLGMIIIGTIENWGRERLSPLPCSHS